jgi:hypothetical protein
VPRTTLDLDAVVLRRLKRRARAERKSLGRLVSDLLAGALDREAPEQPVELEWESAPMRARIDLEDKEAVRRALEVE